MSGTPRILILDLETSPNLAHVWGLFKENISLAQIKEVGQVISFAAKWHDDKRIEFFADYDFETGSLSLHDRMVARAWELLDQADIVVHWNGTSFDIPHLNREFALAGLTPPSPYKQVDLLLTARKQFRFVSNKLDHVAQQLGVGHKLPHAGFSLWLACMAGDAKAWGTMRRYNRRDVEITGKIYERLKPWIVSHPHVGLYSDDPGRDRCGRCGGGLQRRGFSVTGVGRFQRFRCSGCGGWSRAGRRVDGVNARPAA